MSEDHPQNTQQKVSASRPDPYFKFLTRLEAEQLGLQALESEFPQTTRADLVLLVPSGLPLENTLFDFFRAVNVVEFKSQGDRFDLSEYIKNQIRTDLQFLQSKDQSYTNILNVIVSSRLPRSFLEVANQHGVLFQPEPDRPWLWRGQVGFQTVVLLVCQKLPLEQRFYPWLIFAPANGRKWRKLVERLLQQGNRSLLELIEKMRPKEYAMITNDLADKIAEALKRPEFHEPIEESLELQIEMLLEDLEEESLEALGKVLSVLKPENRLVGLTPKDRTKLLKLLLLQAEQAEEQAKKQQPGG